MSDHIIPSNLDQFKTCKKCGVTEPLAEFPMSESKRNGKARRCRRGICRRCLSAYQLANKKHLAKTRQLIQVDTQRCPKCERTLPSSAFGVARSLPNGLQTYCKQCRKEYTAANMEREVERVVAWQRANTKRVYEKQRRWISQNIEKVRSIARASEERRRARKTGAGGSFGAEEWMALCVLYGNHCLSCGKVTKLTADHIVPVSRGGTSNIDNIQPLCQSCNSKKRDKIIDYRPLWREIDHAD